MAGARRTSRRGRDDLTVQRDTARAYAASALGNGTARSNPDPDPGSDGSRAGWLHWSRRTAVSRSATAESPEPAAAQPVPDVLVGCGACSPAHPELQCKELVNSVLGQDLALLLMKEGAPCSAWA
jgi:hypothetical protein